MLSRRRGKLVGAILAVLAVGLVWFWQALPDPLFDVPTATVIEDREGRWRFPAIETLPPRYRTALIAFEDKRFYRHPGVDLLAFARACVQNLKRGRVVSGASTLTMQVIRLSRGNPPRTLTEKGVEALLALRL